MMAKVSPAKARDAAGSSVVSEVVPGFRPERRAAPLVANVAGAPVSTDTSLKVLRVESSVLGTRTFYELPNGIAVLTERDSSALASVVASATSRLPVTAGAGVVGGTSQREAASSPRLFRARPAMSIEWKDAATGTVFVLSGQFSLEELQDLKQRIIASRARRSP
jgi:hypothetical protein